MTMENSCFIISIAALTFTLIWGICRYFTYDRTKLFASRTILIGGTAFAAFVWFLPMYYELRSPKEELYPLISSIFSTIKIFAADGIESAVGGNLDKISGHYIVLGKILTVWAPMLTLSFVLSFFRSASAYFRYYIIPRKKYVFSELNEKTLAMASRIRNGKGGKWCAIAFADIVDKNEEAHLDLVDAAKKIRAIYFRNDVEAIKWSLAIDRILRRNGKNKSISFYIISDDESDKLRHMKSIIERHKNEKCKLFIFDNGENSKLLLNSYHKESQKTPLHIRISRIDDERLTIYSYLVSEGHKLFKRAPRDGESEQINVAIVGFESYGIEMFKALLWYCRMPGYKVNITVIDGDDGAEDRARAMFPGLNIASDPEKEADPGYSINFRCARFGEKRFISEVQSLSEDTRFFVFMGGDEDNIRVANTIRSSRAQANVKISDESKAMHVSTVIFNPDIRELVCKDIGLINGHNGFFRGESIDVGKFVEDGLNEHILGSTPENDIIVFGISEREERVLDTVSEYLDGKGRSAHAVIYTKKYDEKDRDRIKGRFRNIEARIKKFDLSQVEKQFKDDKILFICLEGNGIVTASKLKSSGAKFVIDDNNLKRVKSYLDKGYDVIYESHRNNFYLSDYNFYSSLLRSMHRKLRAEIIDYYNEPYKTVLTETIDPANSRSYKKRMRKRVNNESELPEAERDLTILAEIEHERWNMYMYTEGFVYNQKRDPSLKIHYNIVPVSSLSIEDKIKDI